MPTTPAPMSTRPTASASGQGRRGCPGARRPVRRRGRGRRDRGRGWRVPSIARARTSNRTDCPCVTVSWPVKRLPPGRARDLNGDRSGVDGLRRSELRATRALSAALDCEAGDLVRGRERHGHVGELRLERLRAPAAICSRLGSPLRVASLRDLAVRGPRARVAADFS